MLDASIPMSGQNLQAPDFLGAIQKGQAIRDMAQQRQLQDQQIQQNQVKTDEANRTALEDKTIRGLLDVNNGAVNPNDQTQLLKDLQTTGLGHRVPELAGQFAKQQADRQIAALNVQKEQAGITGQGITQQGQTQEQLAKLNDEFHQMAMIHGFQARAAQDPADRQAIQGSMLAQLQAKKASVQPGSVQDRMIDNEINDVKSHDWTKDENLQYFQSMSAKTPEDMNNIQAIGQWPALKAKLDTIMTPSDQSKGWNPTTGEKGTAYSKAIAAVPSNMTNFPAVKEYLEKAGKEQQQIVFNPATAGGMTLRAQMPAENRISSENQKQTSDYEKVKGPALAFKADYDNYKQAIASGDKQAIKIAQQGMVDKYITTSTQKSTGDAQFNNFITGQGVQNSLQNLGDKYMNGSMAPEKIFDTMKDITMSTAEKFRQKVQQSNAMTRKQADRENKAHGFQIDPEALITHPDEMLAQDSTAFAPNQAPKAGSVVKWGRDASGNPVPL